MKTLVIVPTYNEVQNIEEALRALFEHNPAVDALVVDDDSPDGTGSLVDELAAGNSQIRVLHRAGKQGLGPAYVAGFRWALLNGYEFIVEMDADGSHRAIDLPRMLAAAHSADLVIGSRWVPGGEVVNWPVHRRLLSKFGNRYVRFMLGMRVNDATAGFRVFNRATLNQLDLATVAAQGYSFQVELTWRVAQIGGVITEVPITFVERARGASKMSTRIVVEALTLVTWWGVKRLLKPNRSIKAGASGK